MLQEKGIKLYVKGVLKMSQISKQETCRPGEIGMETKPKPKPAIRQLFYPAKLSFGNKRGVKPSPDR